MCSANISGSKGHAAARLKRALAGEDRKSDSGACYQCQQVAKGLIHLMTPDLTPEELAEALKVTPYSSKC